MLIYICINSALKKIPVMYVPFRNIVTYHVLGGEEYKVVGNFIHPAKIISMIVLRWAV